jgi:hypothetical protein
MRLPLNESELEYAEATKSDNPFLHGDDRPAGRLKRLFMALAFNISRLAIDDSDNSPEVIPPVVEAALNEWERMHLDVLVANLAKPS